MCVPCVLILHHRNKLHETYQWYSERMSLNTEHDLLIVMNAMMCLMVSNSLNKLEIRKIKLAIEVWVSNKFWVILQILRPKSAHFKEGLPVNVLELLLFLNMNNKYAGKISLWKSWDYVLSLCIPEIFGKVYLPVNSTVDGYPIFFFSLSCPSICQMKWGPGTLKFMNITRIFHTICLVTHQSSVFSLLQPTKEKWNG